MLYIIYPNCDYIEYVLTTLAENKNIKLIRFETMSRNRLLVSLMLFLRYIFKRKWFSSNILTKENRTCLSKIKSDDKVLLFSIKDSTEIALLKTEIMSQNISVYLCDPIRRIKTTKIGVALFMGFIRYSRLHYFTFDYEDAIKYKINKICPVWGYIEENLTKTCSNNSNVYYIGTQKGRGNLIAEIAEKLKSEGLKPIFQIIKNKHSEYIGSLSSFYITNPIPYNEVIKELKDVDCILDIVQKNQTGLSFRPLEALFLNKKLITNCSSIKREAFYDKNNVYIIGDETESRTYKEFLDAPYSQISEEIKDLYNIKEWIKQFV